MKDRVVIIDGLNFIYRGLVQFGFTPTIIDKEENYVIVFNFFRNLRALIEALSPNKVFIVLEGNPIFRKTLFPDYKKHRIIKRGVKKLTNVDILQQANIIYDLLRLIPVILVRAKNYEADDTIFALSQNLQNEELIIVSSDSDLIQILQALPKSDIKLYNPIKKQFITPPEYIYLVWKSMAGDKSDNIPSLTSKTQAERLSTYPQELQAFLAIEENKANFLLNKQLIELQSVPAHELEFMEYSTDFNMLFDRFSKMKLMSLIKDTYKLKFVKTFETLT